MHKICFTISFISCHYMFRAHVLIYGCDDTRGCVMQFWPSDDEHMCSKHVEAWNRTYCKTNFVHQVAEINILRCTVQQNVKIYDEHFTFLRERVFFQKRNSRNYKSFAEMCSWLTAWLSGIRSFYKQAFCTLRNPVRCIKFFDHSYNYTFFPPISKTLSRNWRVLESFIST